MATAAVIQPASTPSHTSQTFTSFENVKTLKPEDVHTVLNYYKPNEDGSPPRPTYVDRPETYDRPFEVHPVTVHDVRGHDSDYTLDGNGFQFHKNTSREKDFLDDEKIKNEYYIETEQLLKNV